MLKIKLNKDQKLWFISDTHYNHTNICRGVSSWSNKEKSTHPFNTLEEMNEFLIRAINDNVGQDDILIHLGDWSFGGFEQIEAFRKRIICRNIHLVLGNHDHHIESNRDGCRKHFLSVNHYLELEVKWDIKKDLIGRFEAVCMHYPIASWHNMNRGRIHLHGHVHLRPEHKLHAGRAMDVGFDGHPFSRPYELPEIIRLMKDRPVKTLVLPSDHHEEDIR